MKEAIKKEVLEWYKNKEGHPNEWIEDCIDLIMQKTTDAVIEETSKKLKNEFANGTLNHDFSITREYYIELMLKGVEEKCLKDWGIDNQNTALLLSGKVNSKYSKNYKNRTKK